jgi:hypothetical protein
MEQHQDVVLQERVGPGAAGDAWCTGGERVGRTETQHGEERRHHEHDDQRPSDEDVVGARAEPPGNRSGEPREDQCPQQDRTFERRPHGGDVVERGGVGRAHLLHIGEREVPGDQRPLHHHHGEHDAGECQPRVDRPLLEQLSVVLADAVEHRERAEHRRSQHQQQSGSTQRRVDARCEQHHAAESSGQPACSASATRSSLTATYSSECLTSTRSPSSVPPSITPCTTTGMHSLKMPPGSPS